MTDHEPQLRLALKLADTADTIAAARFGASDLVVDRKPNGGPVTDADRAIEAAVVNELGLAYPEIPIFGEEHGPTYSGEATYWAIDPIDGTAAFIAGDRGWGFTLCLVEQRRPVVGVASSVGLDRRWWAAHPHGAFSTELTSHAPQRLRVSATEHLTDARIGVWDGNTATFGRRSARLDEVRRRLDARVTSITSAGNAPLEVAAGRLDAAIMWANSGAPWDAATFALLVREAGGFVTDLTGSDDIAHGLVLLSNGTLHGALRELLV